MSFCSVNRVARIVPLTLSLDGVDTLPQRLALRKTASNLNNPGECSGSTRVRRKEFGSKAMRKVAQKNAPHCVRCLMSPRTGGKTGLSARRSGSAHLRWCRRCGKAGRHWTRSERVLAGVAESSKQMFGNHRAAWFALCSLLSPMLLQPSQRPMAQLSCTCALWFTDLSDSAI